MKTAHMSAGLCVLLSACRFGGPSGSALELEEPRSDAAIVEDETEVDEAEDPSLPTDSPSDPEPSTPLSDAGVPGGECGRTNVPGCDPVRGTNCTPGINQCIIDRASTVPAGRCVFQGQPLDASCDENDLFATCPPLFTCQQGTCRKYCYCDSDCDPGDSCNEPAQGGSGVFKVCESTRP